MVIENESEKNLILGIDPGRDKIGFAFCDNNKDLILAGIFFFHELDNFLSVLMRGNLKLNELFIFQSWIKENFIKNFDLKNRDLDYIIALGDGTDSYKIHDKLKILNKKIIIVNEQGTTLEARNLYWTMHEPGLFKRLLPQSMRVPDRDLDDLAAWAVARRAVI